MKKFPFRLLASFLIYLLSWFIYIHLYMRFVDDIGGTYWYALAPFTIPIALAIILALDLILQKIKYIRERQPLLISIDLIIGAIVFIPASYLTAIIVW